MYIVKNVVMLLLKWYILNILFFFFSSRRRHTRLQGDWSSDVCSSDLSLLLCTIWLMANGAEGRSGWALSQAARVSVISASQSSSCSAGRALSAGMEPTMPAWHWAITSLGLLMMNSGEPITGRGRFFREIGRA